MGMRLTFTIIVIEFIKIYILKNKNNTLFLQFIIYLIVKMRTIIQISQCILVNNNFIIYYYSINSII